MFPIKPSTKAFWHEARKEKNFTLFKWFHGYVYGRWVYLYISIGTGEHPICRHLKPLAILLKKIFAGARGEKRTGISFADSYHGKVIPLKAAKQFLTVNRKIELRDLEQIIPYNCARDIVLKNPERIVVLECPCRSSRKNPCLPLDVCLIIGEPFASFIEEHHPQKSRSITAEEAEGVLEHAHKSGNVHHAFFKEEMMGRFYAICNCCRCCCGAIKAMKNGTPMLASSGYSIVASEKCLGCGYCVQFCPFDALAIIDKKLQINLNCMGCGICVSKCPQDALQLERDSGKGEPLEIKELIQEANDTAHVAYIPPL